MSAEDKNKSTVWEALLNEIGTVMASRQCTVGARRRARRDLGQRQQGGHGRRGQRHSHDHGHRPISTAPTCTRSMAVLAAVCNYNPVIFLKYPPNYNFSGLGITDESHNLSHRLDNANMTGLATRTRSRCSQTIDKYYVSKFAKLVGMLDGIKNGDGSTLLDNTATVWFNEMSDGNAHNLNNLPIIQAGGCGGYFKTGWAVNVDTANTGSATLTQGNSESQCANGTGDGQRHQPGHRDRSEASANAPINKYFCNIMNAMGVKADSTGFPAKGGTAEVTKFGYSDKTDGLQRRLGRRRRRQPSTTPASSRLSKPANKTRSPYEFSTLEGRICSR